MEAVVWDRLGKQAETHNEEAKLVRGLKRLALKPFYRILVR